MATNPQQRDLDALRQLAEFAEGNATTFPLLVQSGESLVTASSHSQEQLLTLTAADLERLRAELRHTLRHLAVGDSVTVRPMRVGYHLVKHAAVSRRRTRQERPQFLSALVETDRPRDLCMAFAVRVLLTAAVQRLRICPAPNCGKVFVKVTKKRFCSTRCQSRIYMRDKRARERAEQEHFLKTEQRHKGRRRPH